MNRSFSTPTENARRIFLVLNEALATDPEFVDEFLKDEGYDIESLNKEAEGFFKKLAFSDTTKQAAIQKRKILEDAQKQVNINFRLGTVPQDELDEHLALEATLYRDFKGNVSPEDVSETIRKQAVLLILNTKDDTTDESE